MDVLSHCSIWLPYLTKGSTPIALLERVLLFARTARKVVAKRKEKGGRKKTMKEGERRRRCKRTVQILYNIRWRPRRPAFSVQILE